MTKSKDIKNSTYAGIELNGLLNNYNNDRDRQAILTRNFNEIDTPPARIEGSASGGESPHKLYNNFSESGTCENGFQYKTKIEALHGIVYFERPNIILIGEASPAFSNAEIKAL